MLTIAMYLLAAPVIAGSLVLIGLAAPELGLDDIRGIGILAGAGFAVGLPVAVIAARIVRNRAKKPY